MEEKRGRGLIRSGQLYGEGRRKRELGNSPMGRKS
jgi:hypothetical protein